MLGNWEWGTDFSHSNSQFAITKLHIVYSFDDMGKNYKEMIHLTSKLHLKVKRLSILLGAIFGGFLTIIPTSVQALENFSNGGVQFDVDTIIEFEFVSAHGAYRSEFGVINLDTQEKTALIREVKPSDVFQTVTRPSSYKDDRDTNSNEDFLSTPGKAVPQPLAEFLFKANTRYAFYLQSFYNDRPVGILYSTDIQNPTSKQQTKFYGDLSALANGGTEIRWDDTGSALVRTNLQDTDFDDFTVRAGGHIACP
jgi:hypothetical protein